MNAMVTTKLFVKLASSYLARSAVAVWLSLLGICLVSLSNADETKMDTRWVTAATESNPTATNAVAFQTVAKGFRSGVIEATQIVVRTQAEWNTLWQKHSSIEPKPSQAPVIDFSKELVIGVFLGQKPTGGYDVEIVSVEPNDGTLMVSFREKSPQPGAILTQAFTQPFHIVRIGINGTASIRFRRAP